MLDWQMYIEVAESVKRKASERDREDLRQEIIVRLAERGITSRGLAYIVAKEAIMDYWRRERYRQTDSLDWMIFDNEGNQVRVVDTLVANEPNLDNLCFAKELLESMPIRLIKVAAKKVAGYPLTKAEHEYLRRFRKDQTQLRVAWQS